MLKARRQSMSILFLILRILGWIALVILGLFIFLETIVRLVKHFIHLPSPAFVVARLNNPIRRKLLSPERVIDCFAIREGMKILEVGPGSGFFTFELAKYVGLSGHVYAVDIEPKMIRLLEKRSKKEKIENITARVASAYEIPSPNNSVDLVFMGGVLGEIPDKQKALREMQRVLKKEGSLAVMECLIDPDYPRRKTVTGWFEDAGCELTGSYGSAFLYALTFKPKNKVMI
jgi:ubiquinone/menaquinone biosynthesis C-methylase UbiE